MAKKAQGSTVHVSNEDADITAFAAATFAKIGEVKDIQPAGGEAADIDVTHLESAAKEYLVGLPDGGTQQIMFNSLDSDPGQDEMVEAMEVQESRWFKITWASGAVWHYKGRVKKVDRSGGVDKELTGSASIRMSGVLVRA